MPRLFRQVTPGTPASALGTSRSSTLGASRSSTLGTTTLSTLGTATSSTSVSEPSTKDYAVCVVGAVRSMTAREVMQSWSENLVKVAKRSPNGADFFYHLFVGTELSARGQSALPKSAAENLSVALMHATQFQFQYTENDFTCEQMTSGRFFKVSQCASMIRRYQMRENVNYRAIVFTRPDMIISEFKTLPDLKKCQTPAARWWMNLVDGDMYAMSGDALDVAENLTEAECCNSTSRLPLACFIPGQEAPRPNYLLARHFWSQLSGVKKCWNFEGKLVRTPEMMRNHADVPSLMHGKYRQEVERYQTPHVSRTVEFKGNATRESRRDVVYSLLEPAGSR
eukprot:Skav205372  [mRNA]  locus=scaffold4386:84915:85931:- [translate_table: standard]